MKIDPAKDGIDHLNVYSKGRTALGKFLSNFAYSPFTCEDGKFNSIEGYWYWLSVDEKNPSREQLRKSYGFQAKQLGRDLRGKDWVTTTDFKVKIIKAIMVKIEANPAMFKALRENTLPLKHYYCYGNDSTGWKVYEESGSQWMLDYFDTVTKVK